MLDQTKRHAFIVSLLGIRHVVLAINKMDLVGYEAGRFDSIVSDFTALNDRLGFAEIMPIPVSALWDTTSPPDRMKCPGIKAWRC